MVSAVPAEVALSRLTDEEQRWVTEFVAQVRDLLGPRLRDLRLYGSKVRGDDHDESDIDLLVLVAGCDPVTADAVTDRATYISPWLAPMVLDYDRYHSPQSRATGFYEELRRESVRL